MKTFLAILGGAALGAGGVFVLNSFSTPRAVLAGGVPALVQKLKTFSVGA